MEDSSKRSTFCLQNLFLLMFYCLFFFIQYLVSPVTGDFLVTTYDPMENIAIDCGSSTGGQSLDPRPWFGEGDGKFSLIEQSDNKNKSLAIKAANQLPSSVDNVPYSTARLSNSEFTYSIPLTAGPKFIRFYFYPTSYSGIGDLSNKAFFSVKAGQHILLRNFSASLHAGGEHPLVKEYCVNVDGQRLNLTFIPSPDITGSYAFINGIEVVSMPSNLYYRAFGDEDGVTFLGQAQGLLYPIENSTAFELMYRVNVGGREIPPAADTGMFRHWLKDDDYLTIAKPSALPVNTSIELNFNVIPPFSAPTEVYLTARSMGRNKTKNEEYNLTWEFPVDSGFRYFVRLHFCEFQKEITKESDRVFKILLANLTAEAEADVIAWSLGNGVPVYRDYVVEIGTIQGNKKQQNLSIALHPTPAWKTHYSDAILNGVEIFKLSNKFVLAGPNPDPVPINQQTNSPPPSTKSNDNNKSVFGIVGGVISGFLVLSLLCFFIFRRKMRVKDPGSSKGVLQSNQVSSAMKSSKSTKSRGGSSLPSYLCRYFSLAEIKGATNNFDDVFIVGFGGFGNVYKGFIDGGATQVAIKRLNPGSQQGAHEFRTEIEMLSQLRHVHLVSLIGYCNDGDEMILVYDYMARGTLRDHLYNTDNPPLPWKQRLEICLGAATGLQYLHSGAKHTIIHRDVKTTNILLDEKWVAKVSDFGLSRVGPTNMSQTHVSTIVKGSWGYLDPEYSRRGQLTEKSDVYSFGVVLCEILCARPPLSRSAERALISLAPWFQQCHQNGTLHNIIDPFLKDKIVPECLKKFTEVVMSCLDEEGTERPSMDAVVWGLQFALQLQELVEEGIRPNLGAGIGGDIDNSAPFTANEMEDDSGEVFSSIGDHVMNSRSISTFSLTTSDEPSFITEYSDKNPSKAVFSEIRDPQGR